MRSFIWAGWTGLGMALQVYKVELVLTLDSFAAFVAFVAFSEDPSERVFALFRFWLSLWFCNLDLFFTFCFWLPFRHSYGG